MPSAKGGGGFTWVDKTLFRKMPLMAPALDVAIGKVMQYEANEAQNYMRDAAPWNDQTGNARQGLFARAGKEGSILTGGKHFIVLYHTMPYGIFLEVRWSGKYQIIVPATQQTGRNVMQSLNKVMAAMG